MKNKIVASIVCLSCLIIGFVLFPIVLGSQISAESRQVTVFQKLSVLDSLIIDMYNLDKTPDFDYVLDVMCKQLQHSYDEAIESGEPKVELLNPIEYSKGVLDRLNKLASANKSNSSCSIDL